MTNTGTRTGYSLMSGNVTVQESDGVRKMQSYGNTDPIQRDVGKSYGTSITKTRLYNFDPLKPHFYMVKLGFTGVYIILLTSAQKHRLWVLVRTASSRRF